MNIVQLDNKKFKYEMKYRDPTSSKWKKVSVTMESNSSQAYNKAMRLLNEKIAKRTMPKDELEIPLEEIANDFLGQKALRVKEITLNTNRYYLKALLRELPQGASLTEVNANFVQRYINHTVVNSSFGQAKAMLSFIRQLLTYARKNGYIKNTSWLEDIELKAPPLTAKDVQAKDNKFLDKNELAEVLRQVKEINPIVAMILEFQSLTGLRIGELLALRFKDYKDRCISVNGTYNAFGERTSPKNVYSIRKVQLNTRSVEIIEFFIDQAKLQYQLVPPKLEEYIFITKGGLPYDVHFINKVLKRITFNKHVSTHTFRHTHISMLAEHGVPLKAIMERVGHNEAQTTLSVYTHVTNEMKNIVADAIEKF